MIVYQVFFAIFEVPQTIASRHHKSPLPQTVPQTTAKRNHKQCHKQQLQTATSLPQKPQIVTKQYHKIMPLTVPHKRTTNSTTKQRHHYHKNTQKHKQYHKTVPLTVPQNRTTNSTRNGRLLYHFNLLCLELSCPLSRAWYKVQQNKGYLKNTSVELIFIIHLYIIHLCCTVYCHIRFQHIWQNFLYIFLMTIEYVLINFSANF